MEKFDIDDEDFEFKRKRKHKLTREDLIKELKGYRKADKNVSIYEKGYYSLTGKKLKDLDVNGLNDLIFFIINSQLSHERHLKENNSDSSSPLGD